MSEFSIVDVAEGDRLMSQKEAAERLGTNQAFVKRLLDTNLLPCIRFGRYARISVYALTEFIREHQGEDLQKAVEDKELRKERGAV